MSFILRVYCNDRIHNVHLTGGSKKVTIGSDPADTLQLACSGLRSGHITIKSSRDRFVIKGKNIFDRAGSPVSSAEIAAGKVFIVETEPEIHIAVHPRQMDGNHAVCLDGIQELLLGREHTNNIIFNNRRTSSVHCKIYNDFGVLKIRDMGSSNGTYVNGKKIYEKSLVDGDIITIAIYDIVLGVELRDLTKKQRIWLVVGIVCFLVSVILSLFIKNYYVAVLIIPAVFLGKSYYQCLHKKYVTDVPFSMEFKENALDIEVLYAVVINKKGFAALYSVLYRNIKECRYIKTEGKLVLCFDAVKIVRKKAKDIQNEVMCLILPDKHAVQIVEQCKKHITCFEVVDE